LAEIAAEHRKGRRLFVLTTNLDTQRGVVWNLGAVANSGRDDALKLFQDVIIASASIPGVYPAVMIKAGLGDRQFEEMHSDGGSVSQVLMLPPEILRSANSTISIRRPNVNFYVVINNALVPEYALTRNNTLPVIARAYAVLLKSQTQSELTILYDFAKLAGASFHLATIDIHLPYSMLDPFNASYMRAVFNLGYSGMAAGTLWKARPIFR
jgi:predicted acylesterase/phospholipase RssA